MLFILYYHNSSKCLCKCLTSNIICKITCICKIGVSKMFIQVRVLPHSLSIETPISRIHPNLYNSQGLQLVFKVALGVCFALKSWKEYLLLFTYLITLGKDVILPLITKFKTNRPLSNLFVNRILN